MDALIPLVIVLVIVCFSIKRFKPVIWNKIVSRFKK